MGESKLHAVGVRPEDVPTLHSIKSHPRATLGDVIHTLITEHVARYGSGPAPAEGQ